MKTSLFETEHLTDSFWQTTDSFLAHRSGSFVDDAELLGLDRSSDFRHADLAGVDFSNSDLAGFDFTGADLRDAYGINVKWDSTTTFSEADVAGSLFAYSIDAKAYFRDHPQDLEAVERLTREKWTHSILGVETLLRADQTRRSALKIAQGVFDQTTSTVVRSNILMFMRLGTRSDAEHKQFVFNSFARFSDEPSVVIAGIRALGTFYRDDPQVFNWLKLFLDHGDANQRREAYRVLLASKHFLRGIASLRDYAINSRDSLIRRELVGRLAGIAGPAYVRVLRDTAVSNFIDFAEPITRRKLEDMAYRALQAQRMRAREYATSYNVTAFDQMPAVSEEDVREETAIIRSYISALSKHYKIPFVFK